MCAPGSSYVWVKTAGTRGSNAAFNPRDKCTSPNNKSVRWTPAVLLPAPRNGAVSAGADNETSETNQRELPLQT